MDFHHFKFKNYNINNSTLLQVFKKCLIPKLKVYHYWSQNSEVNGVKWWVSIHAEIRCVGINVHIHDVECLEYHGSNVTTIIPNIHTPNRQPQLQSWPTLPHHQSVHDTVVTTHSWMASQHTNMYSVMWSACSWCSAQLTILFLSQNISSSSIPVHSLCLNNGEPEQ